MAVNFFSTDLGGKKVSPPLFFTLPMGALGFFLLLNLTQGCSKH